MDPIRTPADVRRCAVLFVDLRGYTTLCEDLPPAQVASLLDEFYSLVGTAVCEGSGRVHNLAGDSVMAVFGLESHGLPGEGQAALESGRRLIEAFAPLGQRWEAEFQVATGIGVGIHFGDVAEGLLGPSNLRRATLVGDTVNVAARLCHRARAGEVLFSADLAADLSELDRQNVIPLPNFSLRGRTAPVRIYCVPAPERRELPVGGSPSAV
jgi:adenylate cyclase